MMISGRGRVIAPDGNRNRRQTPDTRLGFPAEAPGRRGKDGREPDQSSCPAGQVPRPTGLCHPRTRRCGAHPVPEARRHSPMSRRHGGHAGLSKGPVQGPLTASRTARPVQGRKMRLADRKGGPRSSGPGGSPVPRCGKGDGPRCPRLPEETACRRKAAQRSAGRSVPSHLLEMALSWPSLMALTRMALTASSSSGSSLLRPI